MNREMFMQISIINYQLTIDNYQLTKAANQQFYSPIPDGKEPSL
jgi:hypothetical protein